MFPPERDQKETFEAFHCRFKFENKKQYFVLHRIEDFKTTAPVAKSFFKEIKSVFSIFFSNMKSC
jgi:hypothetical protein